MVVIPYPADYCFRYSVSKIENFGCCQEAVLRVGAAETGFDPGQYELETLIRGV